MKFNPWELLGSVVALAISVLLVLVAVWLCLLVWHQIVLAL